MVRSAFRGALGVLSVALATACLGGQTGQPSSLHCEGTALSPTAAWSGTTVQAAAQAFEGTYAATLRWRIEPRSASTQTPVKFEDAAQLDVSYDGAGATRDCMGQLRVTVSVLLSSNASGIMDAGEATLTIPAGASPRLVGELHYDGDVVRLDATLPEIAAGGGPSGSFDALDPNLPGASASFSEEP